MTNLQLQDTEILEIRKMQYRLSMKFAHRERSEKVIDEIEAEAVEGLANLGFIAHVDAFPILQGEPLTITILQRVDSNLQFDHERKAHDVRLARERGEKILGESEAT